MAKVDPYFKQLLGEEANVDPAYKENLENLGSEITDPVEIFSKVLRPSVTSQMVVFALKVCLQAYLVLQQPGRQDLVVELAWHDPNQ